MVRGEGLEPPSANDAEGSEEFDVIDISKLKNIYEWKALSRKAPPLPPISSKKPKPFRAGDPNPAYKDPYGPAAACVRVSQVEPPGY